MAPNLKIQNLLFYQVCLIFEDLFSIFKIFIVKDYTNEVILSNIPYNQVYRFRVAVYGKNFTNWSEFSDPSNEIDTRIGFLSKNFVLRK
jgi:hypothetical protein